MEIDRILFVSLDKSNTGLFGNVRYNVLNDGCFERRILADSDEEAKEIFRQLYGNKWKINL